MIKLLENVVFGLRFFILAGLLAFTVVSGFYATQLRMDAGFDKQLPIGHEYIADLPGISRPAFRLQPHHRGDGGQ